MRHAGLQNLWRKQLPAAAILSGMSALTILSIVLVYIGFFVEGAPFAVAAIPFFLAITSGSTLRRFALVSGWVGWIALISCWGLVQMGYDPLWVIAAGGGATIIVSLLFAYCGVGLGCLALMLLPFLPGNPLLTTGSILPGTGIFGLLVLPLALILLERINRQKLRLAALCALLAMGHLPPLALAQLKAFNQTSPAAIPMPDVHNDNLNASSGRPISPPPVSPFAILDISDVQAASDWGYFAALADRMQPGSLYITGENIIRSDDTASIAGWCRWVNERDIRVLLGVRNATDGQAQLWYFAPETCSPPVPQPSIEYAAQIGIPGLTGGLLPNPLPAPSTQLPQTAFLACFEGFNLWRWIEVGFTGSPHVITFSNDRWTEPLSVGLLRRKVAHQFERLLGIETAHAEAGKTMLAISLPEERTQR